MIDANALSVILGNIKQESTSNQQYAKAVQSHATLTVRRVDSVLFNAHSQDMLVSCIFVQEMDVTLTLLMVN